ncbi:MAG: hypothetical protein OXI20_08625 [Rhodospirillales bacterium]|nr:hypothetical protein [Rhodospirillales bacterium]
MNDIAVEQVIAGLVFIAPITGCLCRCRLQRRAIAPRRTGIELEELIAVAHKAVVKGTKRGSA